MGGKRAEIESKIAGLKQILTSTDYKALKHADGVLSDAEYEETKQFRQSLRDQINELEAELSAVEESEAADEE